MNIFVIIPTFNEAKNLENLVEKIFSLHPAFNIIVVDDSSPDGTGAIADALSQRYPRLHVIHRPYQAGLGSAYIEGFKAALRGKADLIMEMDADFSHDPCYIARLVEASENAGLVIGSRYINGVRVEGWRFRRLLLSKLANIYVSFVLVKPVWDFTAGFRCYRRTVLEAIDLDRIRSDGYAFQIELIYLTFIEAVHAEALLELLHFTIKNVNLFLRQSQVQAGSGIRLDSKERQAALWS